MSAAYLIPAAFFAWIGVSAFRRGVEKPGEGFNLVGLMSIASALLVAFIAGKGLS